MVRCSPAYMISIHALREESDEPLSPGRYTARKFQSTPSARRATAAIKVGLKHKDISIHALREESDQAPNIVLTQILISIHALREESDP